MILQGGFLIDLERGVGVEVLDEFVAGSLRADEARPAWWERLLAGLLAPVLGGLAGWINRSKPPIKTEVVLGRSRQITLTTYRVGCLGLRRALWLREVAAGNMRLVGVLPRTTQHWEALPDEIRSLLQEAPVGICALSDLYDCHSPDQPDEWTHAIFQVGSPDGVGRRMACGAFWKIFFTSPLEEG
jgi:hypothetical protein